jgi:hypothetical protein
MNFCYLPFKAQWKLYVPPDLTVKTLYFVTECIYRNNVTLQIKNDFCQKKSTTSWSLKWRHTFH